MRTCVIILAAVLQCTACRAPQEARGGQQPDAHGPPPQLQGPPAEGQRATPEQEAHPDAPADADGAQDWSVRARIPVLVGVADFDVDEGTSLDSLTFLAVVPTAEFVIPLEHDWTLVPFLGLGAGWLFDGESGIAILKGGVRAEWERQLNEDLLLRVVPRVRYDANLNRADGLLGDWGSIDLALELRHALGRRSNSVRFQPGLYAQVLWFWNDVEFEVPGLTPDAVDGQLEVGISLGTDATVDVLGFGLPRMFIGVREGDGLQTLSVRFGEL